MFAVGSIFIAGNDQRLKIWSHWSEPSRVRSKVYDVLTNQPSCESVLFKFAQMSLSLKMHVIQGANLAYSKIHDNNILQVVSTNCGHPTVVI